MKDELKQAKKEHKSALKNKVIYTDRRDNMVRQILNSETPKWGSFKLHLIDW